MKLNESITGRTKLLGLLGNPVEHSVSPLLHNTINALLGIDAVYLPMKVEKNRLGEMVEGLRACNFTGFNVTIPFKEEILRYVDQMSDEVRLVGSANTINNSDGRLIACNTDAEGFVRAFEEDTGNSFTAKKVIILGAGGTARSLAAKVASKGAVKLHLINRTIEKADKIAAMIKSRYPVICKTADFKDRILLQNIIKESDIVINTTSVGLHPNTEECPLGEDILFDRKQTVYDVIYNPFKTKLLRLAERTGCKTANGIGMLFYQGILAYEIWMDVKIPEDTLKGLYAEFINYLDK